jgi:protoporphyrinogen oxidase
MVNGQTPKHITILGGGPAGLSVGYYAHKSGIPFTIYEAKERVGGNSVTIRHRNFSFDSGPHLLQTKDIETINEVLDLLRGDAHKLVLPVQTYCDGKLVDFPFSPLNLLRTLGALFLAKTAIEIIRQRFGKRNLTCNFEEFAARAYGKTMAERFLLNYSRKLWGHSALSPKIAGQQLRGLNMTTFLIEMFRGRTAKVRHLGGTIYYPHGGFGIISEKFAEICGAKNIRTESRITSVTHEEHRIRAIELNGRRMVTTDEVVSTLPVNLLVQLMHPKPPEEILATAKSLQFRALVLVVVFVRRQAVTESSSIHFPDPRIPFTRIHEPKKRCKHMAPDDQTSLVAEIPCQENDEIWNQQDQALITRVLWGLQEVKLVTADEIIDASVVRMDNAYPLLEVNYEQKIRQIHAYLENFSNLKITGRTGSFAYLSLHHILKNAKKTIAIYAQDNVHDSENMA